MEELVLRVQDLKKSFDGVPVLRNLSLDVHPGEFVTLLGPSGCGKTTTLRIIAGLMRPDAGRVFLGGQDVTALPPEKRPVNTVFQNYALFPHMNVGRNIGYGLRIRGEKKGVIKEKVAQLLELVQLPGFEERMPAQLSGGQRQRVAIARAVILSPRLLLLDEPLGALDLKLRRQMQTELKALQKRLGIAFVYITHDQEEALNMSDRIAVMSGGQFEQVDTPEMIYERPATQFVAGFIGESALIEGVVTQVDARGVTVEAECGTMRAAGDCGAKVGDRVCVSVHAERIRCALAQVPGFDLPATVLSHRYAGQLLRTELQTRSGQHLVVSGLEPMAELPPAGARVYLNWPDNCAAVIGQGAQA
ncbi:MAG: ABC transporter ATP-binding protein [Clostridia bacterium]